MTVALRWRRLEELDASELAAWTELGLHSVCPNVFVMPQFVRPSARWLTPRRPVRVAWFERPGRSGPELVGVGCFTAERPGLLVPVPHLRAYASEHAFRSGLLIAPGEAGAVAEALARSSSGVGPRWRAIAFRNIEEAGEDFQALHAQVAGQSGAWFELRRFQRPVLRLDGDAPAAERVGASVRKDLRRRLRRLQEQGRVEPHIVRDPVALEAAVENHLRLEHAGWKSGAGSSMLSSDAHAAFFREMAAGFGAIGAAAFAELRLDGEAVASTSNFVVGGVLSAFKTGWDPRFARSSPGRLNELALFEQMAVEWPGVRKFDSNAREDSYLADMVPDRDVMLSGVLGLGPVTARVLRAARWWRPLAHRLGDSL